ncbi:MAG: hypothetical protein HY735_17430 [Verrucomicrobia bacterium]|nr:hypothetical protein [Verrucomicrobiota bacterium]
MLAKKTVALYLSAVFIAGLLAGLAVGFSFGHWKTFAWPRSKDVATHMCDRLRSKLGLTPEQVKSIEPLLSEAAAELQAIQASTAERVTEVFRKLNERQKKFLTSEQQALLDEMERERQQIFHDTFKLKTGPPPPQSVR